MPPIKFAPDWSRIRQRRLFFAAPLYGGMLHFGFHQSVLNLMYLCTQNSVFLGQKYVVNDSLVPRARNRLVAHFLDSDCTDLLFVDSDITFDPLDALSLLSYDQAIVGGIYSRKQVDWARIARAAKQGVPESRLPLFGTVPVLNWLSPSEIRLDELHEVRHLGTGFLRIRREVFETMIQRFGSEMAFDYSGDEPHFKGKVGYDFFRAGVDSCYPVGSGKRQYLSEDWGFCERAQECGYKIWAAPWIRLVHVGPYDYCSDLSVMEEAPDAPAT